MDNLIVDQLFTKYDGIILPKLDAEKDYQSYLSVSKLVSKYKVKYNISFSNEVINSLTKYSNKTLNSMEDELDSYLLDKFSVNSGKEFYKGFPEEVLSVSDSELVLNAIVHYMTGSTEPIIEPEYKKESIGTDLSELLNRKPVKTISHIYTQVEAIKTIFEGIYYSKLALSKEDLNTLGVLSGLIPSFLKYLDSLGNPILRTNLPALYAALWKDIKGKTNGFYFKCDTYTDVLRLANAINGDYYLYEFSPVLTTSDKKMILRTFEHVESTFDDIVHYKEYWKHFDRLCQFSKKRYPQFKAAIKLLYSKGYGVTASSVLQWSIDNLSSGRYTSLKALEKRPSEFCRSLLSILSSPKIDQIRILESFQSVIDKIPSKLLIQLYNRIINLGNSDIRTVSYNGENWFYPENLKEIKLKNNVNIYVLASSIAEKVQSRFISNLPEEYSNIDLSEYRDLAIPTSLQDYKNHFNFITPFTRIKVNKDKLRLLTYWENTKHKDVENVVDVDLSVQFMGNGEDSTISYYNLRNNFAVHSGDITDAPNGAVEAVDIDRIEALNCGYRYALISLYTFTFETFKDVGTVSFGFTDFGSELSLEDTSHISDLYGVSSDNRSCYPALYDMKTNEIIILDKSVKVNELGYGGTNVESNIGNIHDLTNYYSSFKPMTFGDIIPLPKDSDKEYTVEYNSDTALSLVDYALK